ncbi:MAG TPA: sulfatase [Thermoanaerobaculia bacterium]|nr:sulfatase [Thermoanaerobaculia bacterium]
MKAGAVLALLAGAFGAQVGCRGEDVAWQRHGICEHLREARLTGKAARPACTTSWLGAREVRDPQVLATRPQRAVERLSAGEVRALAQAAGSRVALRVALGAQPYLSFVPLRAEGTPYFRFRVSVRREGEPAEVVHAAPAPPPGGPAPPAVAVDLGRWAGEEVELLLDVGAPGGAASGARALWGSPAVYSRRGPPPRASSRAAERPSVLLLGIDTLRADALGAYGRQPSATPALDRLAAESDLFLDAFSCFNVTNPSFASLLTGLYGKHHGVYDFDTALPAAHTTLAEVFAAAGYRTGAVVSIDHLAPRRSGLGQGFAAVEATRGQFAAERGVDWAMDWLAAPAGSGEAARPFFLWLHLFDPHTPHTPPRPFAVGRGAAAPSGLAPPAGWTPFRPVGPRAFRNGVLGGHPDLYAGEVAYLDRQLDRLLGFLESRGLLETTIVVFVSDHGENLEEHGIEYRHAGLWDSTTHVPLFIRWPGAGGGGRRVSGLVQNVDLFPTLLAAAKLEVPPQDGIDLRRLAGRGRRAVFAEHTGRLGAMVRTRDHKYWVSRGNRFVADGTYLYDLRSDARELANLAGRNLPIERALATLLDRWLKQRRPTPGSTPRDLAPEERERLKALGYI